MTIPKIIIAVDGYSSTGKSTFAKAAAARLGFTYLDSGAIYRSVTLAAIESGAITPDGIDIKTLEELMPSLDINFRKMPDGSSHTFIADRDVEKDIRTLEIAKYVSPIAAIPQVRRFVDEILHKCGKDKEIVMDGRDIGSSVFPNAEIKIFMTASPEIRAQRRLKEMLQEGRNVTYEEVVKNLSERDRIDSGRAVSPLVKASDAIVLDSTDMTIEQEIEWLEAIIRERYK